MKERTTAGCCGTRYYPEDLSQLSIVSYAVEMDKLSATELVELLEATLADQGVNYKQIIEDFGQVRASEERNGGRVFEFCDHLRGLVLALLSSQRPWKRIADSLCKIEHIFCGYDADLLLKVDADELITSIRAIKCGNRALAAQMRSLHENIRTLQRIASEYGSLDQFVSQCKPKLVAGNIAKPGRYKLQQVRWALAFEYLRNVGISAGKPDLHIRRLLSAERLNYAASVPSEQDAFDLIAKLANCAGVNPTYLDNLMWIFCAKDYGAICGAKPKCNSCRLRKGCRYPTGFEARNDGI